METLKEVFVSESPLSPTQIGLDDGYATTKIALPSGRVFAFPSRARVGASAITSLNVHHINVREYETGGCRYTAGAVDGESTRFDDYPFSNLNRVIVQHALQEAGLDGSALHVVSGLPVGAFYHAGGNKRLDVIARKTANLLEGVVPTDGRLPAEVASHEVIPEALAAWYDHVLTDGPEGAHLDAEKVRTPLGVVDIGGRTTDYVVVEGESILHRSSGSLRCGLLDVKQQLAEQLQRRFDLVDVSERTVEDAVHTRSVRLFGQTHDVSELLEPALREVVERIYAETRRQLGQGATLERVLFVGGGALALAPHIRQWFPNQVIAPMPVFANARGMLKYLRYVA
jgi:plasmid segregation protein ParM